MAAVVSPLIDAALVVVLLPVKNAGGVHYVERGADLNIVDGPALCGAEGDLDRYMRPKWRRVRTARRVCNGCHAVACSKPTRVSWL